MRDIPVILLRRITKEPRGGEPEEEGVVARNRSQSCHACPAAQQCRSQQLYTDVLTHGSWKMRLFSLGAPHLALGASPPSRRCKRLERAATGCAQPRNAPWELMGRVVRQDHIVSGSDDLQLRLKLRVIQEHLGVSEAALAGRSSDLLSLLPGLQARVLHLQSDLFAGLLRDVSLVAERMVRYSCIRRASLRAMQRAP
jgi:hypothetical protein